MEREQATKFMYDLLRALIAVIETATLERISVALASDDDA